MHSRCKTGAGYSFRCLSTGIDCNMRAQCALQSSAYTAAELSYTIVCALHNRPTMLVEIAVQVAAAAR